MIRAKDPRRFFSQPAPNCRSRRSASSASLASGDTPGSLRTSSSRSWRTPSKMTVSGPSFTSWAVDASGEATSVSRGGEPPSRAVHAGGGALANSSSSAAPEAGTSIATTRPLDDPSVPSKRDGRSEVSALVRVSGHRPIPYRHPRVTLQRLRAGAEADDKASVGVDGGQIAVQQKTALEAVVAAGHGP